MVTWHASALACTAVCTWAHKDRVPCVFRAHCPSATEWAPPWAEPTRWACWQGAAPACCSVSAPIPASPAALPARRRADAALKSGSPYLLALCSDDPLGSQVRSAVALWPPSNRCARPRPCTDGSASQRVVCSLCRALDPPLRRTPWPSGRRRCRRAGRCLPTACRCWPPAAGFPSPCRRRRGRPSPSRACSHKLRSGLGFRVRFVIRIRVMLRVRISLGENVARRIACDSET